MNVQKQINDNTIIFTIGRMNPPTTGHMKLIKDMMTYAVINNIPVVYIILSSSTKPEKGKTNPLECEEKRFILYGGMIDKIKQYLKNEIPEQNHQKIDGLWVEVICMNDPTDPIYGDNPIIKSIKYIISLYPNKTVNCRLYIGSDEVRKFDWIRNYMPDNATIETFGVPRPQGDMSSTYLKTLTLESIDEFKNNIMNLNLPGMTPEMALEIYQTREDEFIGHMLGIGIHADEARNLYYDIRERLKQQYGGVTQRKTKKIKKYKPKKSVKNIKK
jgi:hypothetical protein